VGFENNMQLLNGAKAPDNSALVSQVADNAINMQRSVASVSQARLLLGMQK